MTQTSRGGDALGFGLPGFDDDFAEYYDDAPHGAPTMLRAPTPAAGVPTARPPQPSPPRSPDVDSPFLGLFPGTPVAGVGARSIVGGVCAASS